jgi:putative DNA-invertase from lambdoid prophage Rac
MTMNVLAAVAPFERDLLIEHTQSGLPGHGREARSPAGAQILTEDQRAAVRAALGAGVTVSALARQYETSRETILRAKAPAWACGAL